MFAVRLITFLACALGMVLILAQSVGPKASLAMSVASLCAMGAIWLLSPRGLVSRMAFLAFCALIILRYVFWRVSGTLPPIDDPVSYTFGFILLAAELYCVAVLAINVVVNVRPIERSNAPKVTAGSAPTVDVFIPTYNEDTYILATTIAAAKAMDYPAGKVTVWLLDDGGSDQKCADANPEKAAAARARRAELQALCKALGANYHARARNEHAKAGNLNSGLAVSSGDLVVVFDADHAPFRSFLSETVGYFAVDPKLFLVQTPHVFLNPDPIEKNLKTFARMPSENEMFYGVTQRGLDNWNGSFFCGSAAVLSRKALMTTGGFSGVTITEDCETAFELHARGWTSLYVAKPLIAGLQPETFGSFIGQRSRWCQGMMQIMLLKNPALRPGLKFIQRVSYLSSMTFWFFPIPRLIFMLAPLLHIFLDVKIFVSSIDEAVAFTATYAVANLMMQNYLYGHVRWPWVSELYEYVQGVYLVDAIGSVLWSPRKPTFNVTAKGLSLDKDQLSELSRPFFLVFFFLAAGVAVAAWRWFFEPGVTDLMLLVGAWCLFNLVIASVALGVVTERRQTERVPSLGVARRGRVRIGEASYPVEIIRASSVGCVLKREGGIGLVLNAGRGELLVNSLDGKDVFEPLRIVKANWLRDGEDIEVEFVEPRPHDYKTISDLIYGDPAVIARFIAQRRKPMDLFRGTLQFLAWGVQGPWRAFSQLHREHWQRTKLPSMNVVGSPPEPEGQISQPPVPVSDTPISEADTHWAELRRLIVALPVNQAPIAATPLSLALESKSNVSGVR